jgi:translocation and assembly module TamB
MDSLTVDGLELVMGSEVWLRSNEANIQLAGSLVIDKRAKAYAFTGRLNTPRGVYRLPLAGAGKDFQVTSGDVEFFGTADLDASVDINAQRVVRTYQQNVLNVYVNMGGSLYEPVLTLTSDKQPPIPESEIISYLLFNAPSFEAAGAGAERQQLAFASLQLGYSAVLGSISSELERALISDLGVPIDYFQIRAAETVRGNDMSNVQIAVGRQIDDNLFVTLSPRLCNVSQAVDLFYPSVEYRMGRYWKFTFSADPAQPCGVLTTRAGDFRTQLGVDVLWDRRY